MHLESREGRYLPKHNNILASRQKPKNKWKKTERLGTREEPDNLVNFYSRQKQKLQINGKAGMLHACTMIIVHACASETGLANFSAGQSILTTEIIN